MARCLVQELKTLLEVGGVKQINSIFFGGGNYSLPFNYVTVSHKNVMEYASINMAKIPSV